MLNAGFYAAVALLDLAIAVHTLWIGGGGWAFWGIGLAGAAMAGCAWDEWRKERAP